MLHVSDGKESRQALRAFHQIAEARTIPPVSPTTRSASVDYLRVPVSESGPKLTSTNMDTLMRMAETAMQQPTLALPKNKPIAVDVAAASINRSQSYMSPVKTKGILQPRSLFSPSRSREQNTAAAATATPRARLSEHQECFSSHEPSVSHGDNVDKGLISPSDCRTPLMRRVMGMRSIVISPAHSEDARQLMFLATHTSCEQVAEEETPETPVSVMLTTPKTALSKPSGAQYISQRNRAAALVRWQKYKEGPQSAGQDDATKAESHAGPMSGGAKRSRRRQKAHNLTEGSSPTACSSCPPSQFASIKEGNLPEPVSPFRRGCAAVAGSEGAPKLIIMSLPGQQAYLGQDENNPCAAMAVSPIDAGAQDGEADDETFEPRATKRRRRSCSNGAAPFSTPQGTFRSPDAPRSGKMRRGAPPGPELQRDPDETQLLGEFTDSETICIDIPGRPSFKLQRLFGAPHRLPGLALRQVQCAVVPHTDRTSAFYLAMVRAAEQVGGLVRSATRSEMALLSNAGAVAKGACRASLATFPVVCRGLWRLGVDDVTLQALMAHDIRETEAALDDGEPKMKPSVLTFDMTSPDATQQRQQKKTSGGDKSDRLPPPNSSRPPLAAWSSPPGNSAGSEQTVLKERTVVFAPWTPSVQRSGALTAGGNTDSATRRLSSGRRSTRIRRTSQHMHTSREQEALLSDGGTPEVSGANRRRSDAGSAQLGNSPPQSRREPTCQTAQQQQQTHPQEGCQQQGVEENLQPVGASPEIHAALSTLNIDPAWLPLLQRPPPPSLLAMFDMPSGVDQVTDSLKPSS